MLNNLQVIKYYFFTLKEYKTQKIGYCLLYFCPLSELVSCQDRIFPPVFYNLFVVMLDLGSLNENYFIFLVVLRCTLCLV